MTSYKALTYLNLEGEPIRPGQLLPEAFIAVDAGHEVQLAQLVADKTIARLPDELKERADTIARKAVKHAGGRRESST